MKKTIWSVVSQKSKYAVSTAGFMLFSVAASAQEGEGGGGGAGALPAEVTDAFSTVGGYAASLFAAALVLWVAIRGSVTIFKLANKFLSKAGA